MTNTHPIRSTDADAAIDALLTTTEPVSIVDGLLDLSQGGSTSVPDGVSRAIRSRLEARLAERIKIVTTRKVD
jgi:hypothetical protein